MVKNLIFDFDGTLVDTAPIILRTMQATMLEMNLPEKNESECRATIGLRLEEIPNVLWPEFKNLSVSYAKTYRRIFNELKSKLNVTCFPYVKDSLISLRNSNYKMAVASSRSHRSLEEYLNLTGLADFFVMLIGGDDVILGKPAPDPVNKILETLDWNPSETMTTGDSPFDILMGKRAGTLSCGVTYGNSSYEELKAVNPDYIISSFPEIENIISQR